MDKDPLNLLLDGHILLMRTIVVSFAFHIVEVVAILLLATKHFS